MRYGSIALTVLLAFATAAVCQDAVDAPGDPRWPLEGAYTGVYTRIDGATGTNPTKTRGPVSVDIEGDTYVIEGVERYTPPYGRGRIHVDDRVTFHDEAFHTAEFDWTLIINGEFSLTWEDSTIVLEQYDPEKDRSVRLELRENL